MSEQCLELKNVCKSFRDFTLNNISFTLPQGYIMGLVGPNGAGKTTTIQLILNMLEKDAGKILAFGKDNVVSEKEIKQDIGIVFDSIFYVDSWTVKDTEKAVSIFYDNWRHDSHDAKLLILDEPTSGLDPLTRDEFLEILQDYIRDGQRSVLFSTHITTDLERVADYITLINRGNMIFTGSMEDLLSSYRLIKGKPCDLTADLEKNILGLRKTAMGFEGLITANAAVQYKHCVLDTATIDDIIICIGKGGTKA